MPSFVALLRGVNVGGNKKLTSSDLKAACENAGLEDVRTYLQSGNVVFRSRSAIAAKRIEDAIREQAAVETRVVLRSAAEMKSIVAATPFHGQYNPSGVLVTFLDRELSAEVRSMLEALVKSEELHFAQRELYVCYPDGIATSKLSNAMTEKRLGVVATARNWNTVNALLRMVEE